MVNVLGPFKRVCVLISSLTETRLVDIIFNHIIDIALPTLEIMSLCYKKLVLLYRISLPIIDN